MPPRSVAAPATAAPGNGAGSLLSASMGWLLLALAALLYFVTLDNGLTPAELEVGDLITHQYAQVQARPSNAPGYPLYTMGGWLWFHGVRSILALLGDPLPNPMPILSSYSTLWALLSLWLLYRIFLHLSRSAGSPDGNWPLAWIISAFYAATFSFWYYATTTEQYCSAVAHTLLLVYLFLLWEDALQRKEQATRSGGRADRATRLLLVMAFLCGLTLAHLVTVAVIVPPLALAVLWRKPDLLRRPRLILGTVLAAGAPLVSYLYIYLRGAAHPEWWGAGEWATVQEWFWSFVSTAQGQEELSWGLQPGAPFVGNGFPHLIWQELSVPLLLMGLVGIGMLPRRICLLVYGTLFLYLLLCWVDRFGNWYQVVMPAYPLVLLGLMPLAMSAMTRLAQLALPPQSKSVRHKLWAAAPIVFLVAASGWRFAASWPAADNRDRAGDTALARPAILLAQSLPADTGLFAEYPDAQGLDYLVSIWGLRPDLAVVSSREAGLYLAGGRSVAATWQAAPLLLSELPVDARVELQGTAPDWVLLVPAGNEEALPVAQHSPMRVVGDGIVLAGYRAEEWKGPIGQLGSACRACIGLEDALDVTLFWLVEGGSTPGDWAISVRALAEGVPLTRGGELILQDRPGPVHGLRPFSAIAPGQVVVDSYRLPAARSADTLHVILYRQGEDGFDNLAELRLPRQ